MTGLAPGGAKMRETTALAVFPSSPSMPIGRGFMTAHPPLMDLAWLNLAHWQSASDQRHILHVARVPILFGRNLTLPEDGLALGPNRLATGEGERRFALC